MSRGVSEGPGRARGRARCGRVSHGHWCRPAGRRREAGDPGGPEMPGASTAGGVGGPEPPAAGSAPYASPANSRATLGVGTAVGLLSGIHPPTHPPALSPRPQDLLSGTWQWPVGGARCMGGGLGLPGQGAAVEHGPGRLQGCWAHGLFPPEAGAAGPGPLRTGTLRGPPPGPRDPVGSSGPRGPWSVWGWPWGQETGLGPQPCL